MDVSGGNLQNEEIIEENILGSIPSVQGSEYSVPDIAVTETIKNDVSSGDLPVVPDAVSDVPVVVECLCSETVPLWESDITEYSVTDGLLLIILCVLLFDVFVKRKG